jgi:hypothetical protein
MLSFRTIFSARLRKKIDAESSLLLIGTFAKRNRIPGSRLWRAPE